MRKMINRKGFSLVELMIVVVIMGILIAVAVPLYNAVTDNAEKRTCQDNQRVIRSAYTRCALDDSENKVNSIFNDGYNSFNGSSDDQKAVFKTEFLDCFENGKLPECPVHGTHYIISFNSDVDIVIECSEAKHNY